MAVQVECENCGAHLEFDAKEQAMKCAYCDSVKLVEVKDYKVPEEKDFFTAPTNTGWAIKVVTSKCDGCGATITGVEHSGECAYCGSPYVKEIPPNPNIIRPENLIPFQIDKKHAKSLYNTWLGQGWFRPGDLAKLGRLRELHGMYVPFWTYDCHVHSNWTADSGYYYYETESYTTWENGKSVRKTREVRKTRWVPSSGRRNDAYDDLLIVASKGLDYKLVKKIYPFNLGALVPYKPEFLTGWKAEDYDVDVRQGWGFAKQKVEDEQYSRCSHDVPGDTHRFLSVNNFFSKITYKHILLPIWVASYHYKKKLYHFLVNGQTGELQGYKPWSWLKIGAVAAAVSGIVAGLVYYFFYL
jgi:DNA-directed RNA polymerase subunit RPC12/RpoP